MYIIYIYILYSREFSRSLGFRVLGFRVDVVDDDYDNDNDGDDDYYDDDDVDDDGDVTFNAQVA